MVLLNFASYAAIESAAYGADSDSNVESTASSRDLLKQMRDAESVWNKRQDDSAVPDFEGWQKLMNFEKNAFVIVQNGKDNFAANVFKSPTVKNNFDLSSFVADDTIHVTESMDYSTMSVEPGERLAIKMAWEAGSLSRFDFYLGQPGEMHQNGYHSVQKLRTTRNTVQLPHKLPEGHFLLFAIVKPKQDQFFKFVFVGATH